MSIEFKRHDQHIIVVTQDSVTMGHLVHGWRYEGIDGAVYRSLGSLRKAKRFVRELLAMDAAQTELDAHDSTHPYR